MNPWGTQLAPGMSNANPRDNAQALSWTKDTLPSGNLQVFSHGVWWQLLFSWGVNQRPRPRDKRWISAQKGGWQGQCQGGLSWEQAGTAGLTWRLGKPPMRGEEIRLPTSWSKCPWMGHTGSSALVFLGSQVFLNAVIQCEIHLPMNQCARECTKGCLGCSTYQIHALPARFSIWGRAWWWWLGIKDTEDSDAIGIEISLTDKVQSTVRYRLPVGRRWHLGWLKLLRFH